MRTNIEINDDLLNEAMKLTQIKTKKELVNFALDELIKRKKRLKMLDFWGSNIWEGNLEQMRISDKV